MITRPTDRSATEEVQPHPIVLEMERMAFLLLLALTFPTSQAISDYIVMKRINLNADVICLFTDTKELASNNANIDAFGAILETNGVTNKDEIVNNFKFFAARKQQTEQRVIEVTDEDAATASVQRNHTP